MEGRHNSRHKLHKRMRAFRNHYIAIGEECKERSDRNENILYAIESTVTKATRLAAKTQRMRELKKQHAEYCQQSTSIPTVSAVANEVSPDMKRTYISSAKLETPINYPINRTPYANISPHLQNVGLRSKNDIDYFNEQMQRYSNQVFKKNAKTMTDDDKEIENKNGYKTENIDLQREDQEFANRPNYTLDDVVKCMDDDPIYKKEQPVKYLYPAEKIYETEPSDENKDSNQSAVSQNLEALPYRPVEYKTDHPIHADMAHLHIEERPISSSKYTNETSDMKSPSNQNEKVIKINKGYANNYEDQEDSKIEEVLGEKIHPDVSFDTSNYAADMAPNKFYHEPSQYVTESNVTKYTGNQHPKGIALKIVEIKPTSKLTHFEKTSNGSPKRFEYISNYEQNKSAPVAIMKNINENSMKGDKVLPEEKVPAQNEMIPNVKSSNEQQMDPKSNYDLAHQTVETKMQGQGGNEERHGTNFDNNRYQDEYLTDKQHHINEMSLKENYASYQQNTNFANSAENDNQINAQSVNNQDPSFGSQQVQTWYNNESQQFSYNSGNIDDSNQYHEQIQNFQQENQGYQEQNKDFQEQSQSFQDQNQSFQEQNQSFEEQNQSFQEQNQSFQEQNQSFQEPNQGFQEQNEDTSGEVHGQTEDQQNYNEAYDQYSSQQNNTYFSEGNENQDQSAYYENPNLGSNIQEENQYQAQFHEEANQFSAQQDPNFEGYNENPNPEQTESPIQNAETNAPQTNQDDLIYNNDSAVPPQSFSVTPENQNMDLHQTNYQDVYNTDNTQAQNQISFQEGHDASNEYFEHPENNVPYSQEMNPPVQNQTENMLGANDNLYQQNHNEYPQTNTSDAHNQNLLAQSSEVVSQDHELNTQNVENHALGSQDSQQYMQQVPESEYYPGDQTMYSNDQGEYYQQYQQDPNLYAGDPNYSQDPQQYQDNTQYAPDTNTYEDGYVYTAEGAEKPEGVEPIVNAE